MSAGLLSLLQNQGFEVSCNSDESFYATDNQNMGLAAYTNTAGGKEYYLFMKENTFNQDLLSLEQLLVNQGFKGGKHNFGPFTISKIKLLPTIIEQYNALLKKHKEKPLLAFIELADNLGENETNIEHLLSGLGIKGMIRINSQYKLYKKHPNIEKQYNSLLNKHKEKPLLAFVELVDNLGENEGNIEWVLRGLGIKGAEYISSTYKLYKKHPNIEKQYNSLLNKHKEKPLLAFVELVDNLGENETNVQQALYGLGVKGMIRINSHYKLYKKHPNIENQYNSLLKKHSKKPLLAFIELADNLGENETNIEHLLSGLGIKGMMHINSYYKLYKKHPNIEKQYNALLKKHKEKPLLAFVELVDNLGENEGNIEQVLNGLGIKEVMYASSHYKVFKKHPNIENQYNSLLKKHSKKPLLAFVELVDNLRENEGNIEKVLYGLGIKGMMHINSHYRLYKKHTKIEDQYNSLLKKHKDKQLLAFIELVDTLRENETNVQQALYGLGVKGMIRINSYYRLYKKHPNIENQYNSLLNKHKNKPLLAFVELVDNLGENEGNIEEVLNGLGIKGIKYISSHYKLFKKHPNIENQYNSLLKKHSKKPLLAFVELVNNLRENEGNIEKVLYGLGIKGMRCVSTAYKLFKAFPCIDQKFETLESKSNPVEAVCTISDLIDEKESNIAEVLNGFGYGLSALDILTDMYKDQSFQPIRNKLLNKETLFEEDVYDFLINFGDAHYDVTRVFFKRIKSGVLTQVIKRAVLKAQEEFDQIAEQVYASQKNQVINLLEQGKKKGHKTFGMGERELSAQLNIPYYVSKKLAEWVLVEQFPKAKDIKDLKKQAKAKGYRLNHWTYHRAMKTIKSA